jgi:hypothetical protein
MSDPAFERTLSYRLSAAYDCWGHRRTLRRGTHNGIWFLDTTEIAEPPIRHHDNDSNTARAQRLLEFHASGQFSATELATLHALVVERLTIAEIAARDGCTRQAVMARLVGNSRGQGGILKKARTFRDNDHVLTTSVGDSQ